MNNWQPTTIPTQQSFVSKARGEIERLAGAVRNLEFKLKHLAREEKLSDLYQWVAFHNEDQAHFMAGAENVTDAIKTLNGQIAEAWSSTRRFGLGVTCRSPSPV